MGLPISKNGDHGPVNDLPINPQRFDAPAHARRIGDLDLIPRIAELPRDGEARPSGRDGLFDNRPSGPP